MKLILIYPTLGHREAEAFIDEARMEPLQLGILAALTPPDVDVVLYDDRIETIPFDEPADLVAITVQIFTAKRAYEISAGYRARGVRVIMGGVHVSLIPQEAAAHADSIFIGDAEWLWAQVIDDARHGRLQPIYRAPVGHARSGGILPRRDLFKGKGYLPLTLLQFSRGCHFGCDFCAVSAYFSRNHYCRSIEDTINEIKAQDRRYLFFVDDNILSDHTAAKALLRRLIPLNVHWVSQGSIDMTRDPELMELIVRSGCLGFVIGFESILPESLRTMQKTPNLMTEFDGYRSQTEILREHGLQTWAAFVLGHEHDTVDSIDQTLQFALENKFTFAAFNVLMPYPGTPLYHRLQAEDRLLYDGQWWLHPDYRFNYAAFKPLRMTPDELTEAGFRCRSVYNSTGNLIRRAFTPRTNMSSLLRFGIYLMYGHLFRQESFKKHGMRLGLQQAPDE